MDLAGDDPPGEDYLAKTARMNTARLEAENQVIRELLLPEPEPTADPQDLPLPAPAIQPQDSPA
jgi:hypothetical protein